MRVGIAADHAGLVLKAELAIRLLTVGHQVVDLGAYHTDSTDDYPDFVVPLGQRVAAGTLERGIAICGTGIGASICANKIRGVRAAVVHDHFSARQGVEDDHMNILCLGGRTVGSAIAWDLVEAFLGAKFSHDERHLRRIHKIGELEGNEGTLAASPAS